MKIEISYTNKKNRFDICPNKYKKVISSYGKKLIQTLKQHENNLNTLKNGKVIAPVSYTERNGPKLYINDIYIDNILIWSDIKGFTQEWEKVVLFAELKY